MTLARRAVAWITVAMAGGVMWPGPVAYAAAADPVAQAWYQRVVGDLHPLQSTLPNVLNAASGWASGSESAAKARSEIAHDLPALERVQRALSDLAPLKGHATAHDDYVHAISLYVMSLRVDLAATAEPSGLLQVQLQHSYQRIRELGDIVFDQGTAELAPELGSSLAGPDVAAAAHVPDWSADGLAPAPPLASSWRPRAAPASGSQPEAEWAAAVTMDGAPAQAVVRAAVLGHARRSNLGQVVYSLGAAQGYVGSVSGPAGEPQAANRLQLGLLVDAEALMSARAARLSRGAPARTLATVGAELASIGGRLRAES